MLLTSTLQKIGNHYFQPKMAYELITCTDVKSMSSFAPTITTFVIII